MSHAVKVQMYLWSLTLLEGRDVIMRKIAILAIAAAMVFASACAAEKDEPVIRDMSTESYLCDVVDVTAPDGYEFDYETEYVDGDQAPLSEAHWACKDIDICLQLLQKAPDIGSGKDEYENYGEQVYDKHFEKAGYRMALYMSREDRQPLSKEDRQVFDEFYSSLKERDSGLSEEHEEINGMADIDTPNGFFPTTISWGKNDDGSLCVLKEWINDKDAALELLYQWKNENDTLSMDLTGDKNPLSKKLSIDGKDYEIRMYHLHFDETDESEAENLSEESRQAFEDACKSIAH